MFSRKIMIVRRSLVLIVPLVLSPLLFFGSELKCVFCVALMSAFWIGEVFPIGITSLFPIFLFPLLGIQSSKKVTPAYFKDSVAMFMSTLIMAMGVEATGLHRRIALKLLTKVGSNRIVMLLGFMGVTAFVSFFVSDTACTALMTPIAIAILSTLADAKNDGLGVTTEAYESVADQLHLNTMSRVDRGFSKALILACAHSSLIGGTSIITSTGANIIFREYLTKYFPNEEVTMGYLQWIVFAMPPMFLYLLASFTVLVTVFLGPCELLRLKPAKDQKTIEIEENIAEMYKELGPIRFGEKTVFSLFVILISTWIAREPGFAPGWSNLLDDPSYITDTVPALLICTLLFIIPVDPFNKKDPFKPILTWTSMKEKFSWSCTLLIGAGFALSNGFDKSGLSRAIACTLKTAFDGMSAVPLQMSVTAAIVIMTEFASNASTASIFIPIMINVASAMNVHPLYLALPTATACSFAFMLPVSTPANAIVYDTRVISMHEMILTGALLNILCILITTLNMNTWTYWVFNLGDLPATAVLNFTNISC